MEDYNIMANGKTDIPSTEKFTDSFLNKELVVTSNFNIFQEQPEFKTIGTLFPKANHDSEQELTCQANSHRKGKFMSTSIGNNTRGSPSVQSLNLMQNAFSDANLTNPNDIDFSGSRIRTGNAQGPEDSSESCTDSNTVPHKLSDELEETCEGRPPATGSIASSSSCDALLASQASPSSIINTFVNSSGKPALVWTVGEVQQWLADLGYTDLADKFQEQRISGEVLVTLTENDLRDELHVKVNLRYLFILHLCQQSTICTICNIFFLNAPGIHFAFLRSALSLCSAFALRSHIEAVCTSVKTRNVGLFSC